MQIIYTKYSGQIFRNEKAFTVEPTEYVLLVLEQEEVIKQLMKRTNFSTRACFNNITLILFQSDYKYWNMEIPKNISMEAFLILYDMMYKVKSIPLVELINSDFLNQSSKISAFFNR